METLKRIVTIPDNHHLKLDVTLPNSFPTGEVELVLVVASKPNYTNRHRQVLSLAGRWSIEKICQFFWRSLNSTKNIT